MRLSRYKLHVKKNNEWFQFVSNALNKKIMCLNNENTFGLSQWRMSDFKFDTEKANPQI